MAAEGSYLLVCWRVVSQELVRYPQRTEISSLGIDEFPVSKRGQLYAAASDIDE